MLCIKILPKALFAFVVATSIGVPDPIPNFSWFQFRSSFEMCQ